MTALDVFRKTVMQTVETQMAQSTREMEAEWESEVESALQTAKKQAAERLNDERDHMDLRMNKEIAHAVQESKRALLELRGALTDELFNTIQADLQKFVHNPEYPAYFKNKLHRCMGAPFAFIQVMERDRGLVEGDGLAYVPTQEDFIGGFKLITADQKATADYTIKFLLDEQRANFPILYNECIHHE